MSLLLKSLISDSYCINPFVLCLEYRKFSAQRTNYCALCTLSEVEGLSGFWFDRNYCLINYVCTCIKREYMSENTNNYLTDCLFFTANSLTRSITRMAEEEFARWRLSPSHAFMLMRVVEQPGVTQKELAKHLHLAQSTVSRLAEKLVQRGYATKKIQGKMAQVFPTLEGQEQLPVITECWRSLFDRYKKVLGEETALKLTDLTNDAYVKIENSF